MEQEQPYQPQQPLVVSDSSASTDHHLCQWVDYLPDQHAQKDADETNEKDPLTKRLSMDPSETNMTETNDSMDMEDWPDSSSLEGYSMLPPAMLLDNDPIIQQELLLDSSVVGSEDPSIAPELFANSLEELLEHRRNQLATYMQASMRTRQFLEPHIRQRAGLATILTQIERSSITIQEHLLLNKNNDNDKNSRESTTLRVENDTDEISNPSVDLTGMDVVDEDVEDFAASVLADDTDCL